MKKSVLIRVGISVAAAALLTLLLSFGVLFTPEYAPLNPLYSADMSVSDAVFQHAGSISGDVVVIGIDARSLEDFGPFPWPRDLMADAIEALNANPETRPAVIGIDVLYTGGSDPEADARLAEAAARYGNVVVAMSGVYGDELMTGDNFYMKKNVVVSYDEPYPALKRGADSGHVNAMLDRDGVLRHGIYTIALPDGGGNIKSFAAGIADKYRAGNGLPPSTPPVAGQNAFYIPFTALPEAFGIASISDVIQGETLDTGGKIVLIGPYAAGLQDAAVTSVDHGAQMFGIEVHANIIESFLKNDFKTEVPGAPQAVIVFLASALCLLWYWDRKIQTATLVWALLTAGSIVLSKLLYVAGFVTHALWLPLAVTVLYIVTVAFNYIRAALEKRRVTSTFKRYVAPEIVTELLREGSNALALGGKLVDIAVLFVDIRGFTSMSELMSAPEVVEILNEYLTLTSKAVMDNRGTLDKFVGDCTMAFWGAPLPQEDCVFKAVKTAIDMVEGSVALSEELLQKFGRSVSFGVGVHYGPAVVGNIGAANRMDYTAIGDTVNTAARLEANAPSGKILVSRAVADALAGRVVFTSLGDSIKLKGKAEGFEVLTVDGYAGN